MKSLIQSLVAVFNNFQNSAAVANKSFLLAVERQAILNDLQFCMDGAPAFHRYLSTEHVDNFLEAVQEYLHKHSAMVIVDRSAACSLHKKLELTQDLNNEVKQARQEVVQNGILLGMLYAANPIADKELTSKLLKAVLESDDVSSEEREAALHQVFRKLVSISIEACRSQVGLLLKQFNKSEFEAIQHQLMTANSEEWTKLFASAQNEKVIILQYCGHSKEEVEILPPEAKLQYLFGIDPLLNDSLSLWECFKSPDYHELLNFVVREVLNLGVPLSGSNLRYMFSQLQIVLDAASTKQFPSLQVESSDIVELANLTIEYRLGNRQVLRENPKVFLIL